VIIGWIDKLRVYRSALKFKNVPENPVMCCAGAKVKLPKLYSPPEPLPIVVIKWRKPIETFLGKHTRAQFMFLNDTVRCGKYYARELLANVQSAKAIKCINFSRGQLHVVCSRDGKLRYIFVYAPNGKIKYYVAKNTLTNKIKTLSFFE